MDEIVGVILEGAAEVAFGLVEVAAEAALWLIPGSEASKPKEAVDPKKDVAQEETPPGAPSDIQAPPSAEPA